MLIFNLKNKINSKISNKLTFDLTNYNLTSKLIKQAYSRLNIYAKI